MELEQQELPPWKHHIGHGVLFVVAYVTVRAAIATVDSVRSLLSIGDPFDVWGDDDDYL